MVYCLCVKKMPLFVLIRSFVRDTSEPVLWDVYIIEHMITGLLCIATGPAHSRSPLSNSRYIYLYTFSLPLCNRHILRPPMLFGRQVQTCPYDMTFEHLYDIHAIAV